MFTKKTLEEEAETEDIEKYIKDTDNDGIPDRIEEALGLDPNNADKEFKPFATIMQMEVPFEGVF